MLPSSFVCRRTALIAAALILPHGMLSARAQPALQPMAPAEIDRAVAAFTGAGSGAPGGARQPADPRLRLARCPAPLGVSWHSETRQAVRVECSSGPHPWRIFVMVESAASASATARPAAPAIRRGDALTILVRGPGFSVQQPGEAMEAGGIGDWILVRTARKAEPLKARVERPGLAVIPAG